MKRQNIKIELQINLTTVIWFLLIWKQESLFHKF